MQNAPNQNTWRLLVRPRDCHSLVHYLCTPKQHPFLSWRVVGSPLQQPLRLFVCVLFNMSIFAWLLCKILIFNALRFLFTILYTGVAPKICKLLIINKLRRFAILWAFRARKTKKRHRFFVPCRFSVDFERVLFLRLFAAVVSPVLLFVGVGWCRLLFFVL